MRGGDKFLVLAISITNTFTSTITTTITMTITVTITSLPDEREGVRKRPQEAEPQVC